MYLKAFVKYLIAIAYSAAYQLVHISFLFNYFEYLGYKSYPFAYYDVIVTGIFILLPLNLLGKGNSFIEVCFSSIYFLLYVPIMITFLNHYQTFEDRIYNQIFFFIGFCIVFFIPRHIRIRSIKSQWHNFNINAVLIITGAEALFLIIYFRNSFSIVSFADVYTHRAEVKSEIGFMSYFVLWNTYFLGPLTIIIGLLKSRKLFLVVGTLATISVYGISASKISLFVPLVIVGTYYIIKRRKSIFNYYGVGLIALIAIFLTVQRKLFILSAVVLMRTIGMGGLLTYQYNEFFKTFPKTYMSHLNLVNAITHSYPYSKALGYIVAEQYVAGDGNANANFWATDGIAGFGLFGVILISIVFGLLLAFLKPIENKNSYMLLALIFVPFNMILLNVGLFTSFVSGGLVFVILYVYIKRRQT